MKPVISVLLPVYNGEAYLKPAIESVLKQTFQDWELFVSDNASTDATLDIIESYRDPRIRVHRQARNIGMVPNWDFLLKNACGDFACVLGADDVFAPDHLERKINLLLQNGSSPYAHGAVRFIDSEGNDLPTDDFKCAPIEDKSVTLPRFLKMNFVNVTSTVFRISALRRHNLGFESLYPLMMDWMLHMKLAMLDGWLVYDSKPTASYRIHPESVARKSMESFAWSYESTRLRVDALTQYPAVWQEIGVDYQREAQFLTKRFSRLAFQQFRRGNFDNARQAWLFFCEFHSILTALLDVPQYAVTGLRKTRVRSGENLSDNLIIR